jgi:hypothetical protein
MPGQLPRNGNARTPQALKSFPVEQNQTKALSCPAVLFRSYRKATHANGKRDAFLLREARTILDALSLRKERTNVS